MSKRNYLDHKRYTTDQALEMGLKVDAESLYVIPGGKLVYVMWNYDALIGEGNYVILDVSHQVPYHLWDRVEFSRDLKLKDIFQFTLDNITLLEPVIGDWCREICEEGLTNIVPYTEEYNNDKIEYLELYRIVSQEKGYDGIEMRYLEGIDDIDFHGIGVELIEDHNYHAKGSRIPWSVSFIKNNEIADTPIRINDIVPMYNEYNKESEFRAYQPKLLLVLKAIFWELSWYGPPESRDEESTKLKELIP